MLYTVVAEVPARRAYVAAALALAAPVAAKICTGAEGDIVAVALFSVAPVVVGRLVNRSRAQADHLRRVTARLARERDACARLAAFDERARIARDLHDSVAHAVSVMVLQAGAAEQVLASAPDRAADAISAIQDQGRTALSELHQLLGMLDDDEQPSPRSPQPGLGQLETLLAHAAGTGLPVRLDVHGEPTPLPAGLDLSAYRIIQEALTNALKHAGPVPTTVTLDYTPDALTIEIHDHGNGAPARAADGAGHGLIGMRERVSLYHGDLEAGRSPHAGYCVRARIPIAGASA
jgi:signal transduction histidine kinase